MDLNQYTVVLKSGRELTLTRHEESHHSAIGLWKWALKQVTPTTMNFNEMEVLASAIAGIYNNPVNVGDSEELAMKDVADYIEEKLSEPDEKGADPIEDPEYTKEVEEEAAGAWYKLKNWGKRK
jgi:hypothetical protein